ncbi:sacsin N-terminal ATP-binding-like domain-containing protein [Rhodopseudomonas pseudopalustris]|uniref:Histidine kinase-, DNA gyrase B-, and HSP90-like ATPase n=1 Tax=Rhodopseudomonas pseudopalustris TaxID=1513892 RepID=A0A1H8SP81_9BRAD|nr:ATPase [Rhodopseudomonas pseudopalustris]SEO80375.1 hypothetical protein SAMN05444123_1053 [Rhodopseudomonas pseudopalustris]
MSAQPAYFEAIRKKAASRWDQLEQDPELAGPWYQLFSQVQSPRHILSELLQNADDAGASEASVRIEDDAFVFEHNGEDFAPEHFASLCGFGYSNKRALHTIGFRGIGFKSTFSLGETVELFTPSLAVCFQRRRFTEPHWLLEKAATGNLTRIRVRLSDQKRRKEVEKNLDEWLKSPVSLLFFRNVRCIHIAGSEVRWGSLGPGPIPDSEWMALYDKQDDAYLLVRSPDEPFPADALAEIQQERMVGSGDSSEFPPCKVEIVLGAKGRLYVVLPTGVETGLPFACNAPFIQDPARVKIKDPEISPTNRWLLERAGKLAASAMLTWVRDADASIAERSRAYRLLPDVNREDNSLEGVCGTAVEESFAAAIEGVSFLLSEDGSLVPQGDCTAIPGPLFDVWSPKQAVSLLDETGRPVLARHVEIGDRQKMVRWGLVEEIDKQKLLTILKSKHLPRPDTWRQLMNLWAYITPDIAGYRYFANPEDVRIVPVQGKDVLYAASEVVRLGEKKLLQSDDDWEFLASHLLVLNQNWPRFLAEERRNAVEKSDALTREAVERTYNVLKTIGLDDTSDVNRVIDQVAQGVFAEKSVPLKGCVQLAQIAAKLGTSVTEAFRFATRDRRLRAISSPIYFDEDGKLEDLLPDEQLETNVLHPDYTSTFHSCSSEDWQRWVASGRAGLLTFVPLVQSDMRLFGKRAIEQEARKRGHHAEMNYPYVTHEFIIEDWDFESDVWSHWRKLASQDEVLWCKVVDRLIAQRDSYWSSAKSARFLQVATTGRRQSITHLQAMPSWCLRLRELPCLSDSRGFRRRPDELLRRTHQTEALMDVEPFVHALLDRETTRPLLDLLGVRSTPTGPDGMLDRLRAISKAERPPIHEVDKWYRRLDQLIETCSSTDLYRIRQAFRTEALIFTQEGAWTSATAVFLSSNDDDVPEAAVIRQSVTDLTLWRKIGIAERPTAELAIAWLETLPSGKVLSQEDARRVGALLVRYPIRILDECKHWLSLAGGWVPFEQLSYALTMQSLTAWSHLHQWVKVKTADFRRLPVEVTSNAPFSELPSLVSRVEERLHRELFPCAAPEHKEWLAVLGEELLRVELERDDETQRVRALAVALAETQWHTKDELEIIPYIGGTPAGTPRKADVVWLGRALYVGNQPLAKLARRVPEEVGKAFGRPDIKAALDYSFERSPPDIRDYLQENFILAPRAAEPADPVNPLDDQQPERPRPDLHLEPPTEAANTNQLDNENVIVEFNGGEEPFSEKEGDALASDTVAETPELRPRHAPKPARPSLIERFAKAEGFKKDGEERFFHENGSWIGRAEGSIFPWELRNRSGDLVRTYLPIPWCLERDPLEIKAEVWGLLNQHPNTYSLIATRPDDSPTELTGNALLELLRAGRVNLFPATYRLVHDAAE